MPTIHRLGATTIRIYFDDHNPPHFHIVTRDGDAVVDIETLSVMESGVDSKNLRKALKWASENQDLLRAKWNELQGD